jgi:hypothetical protein
MELKNGEVWAQRSFPNNRLVIQWVDSDQWMLMSFPEMSRHGWVASMPTTGGPAGKVVLSGDEARERLAASSYEPQDRGVDDPQPY